ncbi:MAG: hypothetical protein JNK21_08695 [Rhodospirillaceae bacterium]|nr:hypothetical protein [Rhodospirillaceae bacterium]
MSRNGQREQRQMMSSTQRDQIFFREREAERQANAEKSARLRALRLAKEAGEREAAEKAAAEKAARPKRKATAPPDTDLKP